MASSSVKRRLLLVNPRNFMANHGDLGCVRFLTHKTGSMLCATLAMIDALTPDEWDVTVVEENHDEIDYSQHYDIVGLSVYIQQLWRAKEISEHFRSKGTLVVAGGPSVALNPEVWEDVADVRFVGEAERTWPRFLKDYAEGKWEKEYREEERFDLSVLSLITAGIPRGPYRMRSAASFRPVEGALTTVSSVLPLSIAAID